MTLRWGQKAPICAEASRHGEDSCQGLEHFTFSASCNAHDGVNGAHEMVDFRFICKRQIFPLPEGFGCARVTSKASLTNLDDLGIVQGISFSSRVKAVCAVIVL